MRRSRRDAVRRAAHGLRDDRNSLHAARELRRDFAARQSREMHGLELVGHARPRAVGVVDAHGKDEHRAVGHVARAVDRITPFAAEIAFDAALGGRRDDRDEIRAAGDVVLDLAVVVVAAFEPLEVEPRRHARRVEAGLEALHRRQVVARVADEDGVLRHLALGRQEALRRRAERNRPRRARAASSSGGAARRRTSRRRCRRACARSPAAGTPSGARRRRSGCRPAPRRRRADRRAGGAWPCAGRGARASWRNCCR